MMLTIECKKCRHTDSLRGWIEPEDLKGTEWEGYTQEQIDEAEREDPLIFSGLDPVDRFQATEQCPYCGSTDIISF